MEAKEVKAFFERVASDWDTMRLVYYDERVIEKMAAVSGIGEASEVADVGTGTGFVAAGLATLSLAARRTPSVAVPHRVRPLGKGVKSALIED